MGFSNTQGAAASTFTQLATAMDGSTDFFEVTDADMAGTVDGKQGTVFLSFTRANGTSTHGFFGSDNANLVSQIGSGDDKATFRWKDSSAVDTMRVESGSTFGVSDQDYHTILFSFDLTDSGTRQFLVDGVDDSANWISFVNADLDYTDTTGWGVGALDDAGGSPWEGDLAVVYFAPTFIDLSVPANVAKFIDADNKPVFMGYNGELPLGGTSPLMFFAGFPFRNTARGGPFVENGTPVVSSAFPTD